MSVLVVSNSQFQQMQSYKTLTINQKERQQLKHILIDYIKQAVSLRWNRAKKLLQVMDTILYFATDRGYSFFGRETLAKKCKVSLRTVDKAISILKQSNEVVVAYRENPSSNGYKTPIILVKRHEHFKYWKTLLNIEDNVSCEVECEENSIVSRGQADKNNPYLFITKKQESNIYIHNSYEIEGSSPKELVQYVVNRVQDSINKGTKIKYLSSYIDRIVRSLENQAIFAENARLIKLHKQREEEASEKLRQLLGLEKRKPVPFYNWLEE